MINQSSALIEAHSQVVLAAWIQHGLDHLQGTYNKTVNPMVGEVSAIPSRFFVASTALFLKSTRLASLGTACA